LKEIDGPVPCGPRRGRRPIREHRRPDRAPETGGGPV